VARESSALASGTFKAALNNISDGLGEAAGDGTPYTVGADNTAVIGSLFAAVENIPLPLGARNSAIGRFTCKSSLSIARI
jgi:hypothetical protein